MKIIPENDVERKALESHDLAAYIMVPATLDGNGLVITAWMPNFISFAVSQEIGDIALHAQRAGALGAMVGASYCYAVSQTSKKKINEEQFMAAFADEVEKSAGTIIRRK